MSKLSHPVVPQSLPLSNELDSLISQGFLGGGNTLLTHSKGSNNYSHSQYIHEEIYYSGTQRLAGQSSSTGHGQFTYMSFTVARLLPADTMVSGRWQALASLGVWLSWPKAGCRAGPHSSHSCPEKVLSLQNPWYSQLGGNGALKYQPPGLAFGGAAQPAGSPLTGHRPSLGIYEIGSNQHSRGSSANI